LCGHATLAAAHALYETGRVADRNQVITFHTLTSGTLTAVGRVEGGSIELDFPSTPPNRVEMTQDELQNVMEGFHIASVEEILFAGRSIYDLLIEVTPKAFYRLKDAANYGAIGRLGGRGVLLTCLGAVHRAKANTTSAYNTSNTSNTSTNTTDDASHSILDNERFDFLSRCFFPCYGINEDPVTGSAHCALAPYWFSKDLQRYKITRTASPLGLETSVDTTGTSTSRTHISTSTSPYSSSSALVGYQASPRGGIVYVSLAGDNLDRVKLSGPAVTTIRSKLLC
jgi:predicted PhzF superfamily epimerase YddE/YHI9